MLLNVSLAESVRFELTRILRPCRFSRPVHSTALPTLRAGHYFNFGQARRFGRTQPPTVATGSDNTTHYQMLAVDNAFKSRIRCIATSGGFL